MLKLFVLVVACLAFAHALEDDSVDERKPIVSPTRIRFNCTDRILGAQHFVTMTPYFESLPTYKAPNGYPDGCACVGGDPTPGGGYDYECTSEYQTDGPCDWQYVKFSDGNYVKVASQGEPDSSFDFKILSGKVIWEVCGQWEDVGDPEWNLMLAAGASLKVVHTYQDHSYHNPEGFGTPGNLCHWTTNKWMGPYECEAKETGKQLCVENAGDQTTVDENGEVYGGFCTRCTDVPLPNYANGDEACADQTDTPVCDPNFNMCVDALELVPCLDDHTCWLDGDRSPFCDLDPVSETYHTCIACWEWPAGKDGFADGSAKCKALSEEESEPENQFCTWQGDCVDWQDTNVTKKVIRTAYDRGAFIQKKIGKYFDITETSELFVVISIDAIVLMQGASIEFNNITVDTDGLWADRGSSITIIGSWFSGDGISCIQCNLTIEASYVEGDGALLNTPYPWQFFHDDFLGALPFRKTNPYLTLTPTKPSGKKWKLRDLVHVTREDVLTQFPAPLSDRAVHIDIKNSIVMMENPCYQLGYSANVIGDRYACPFPHSMIWTDVTYVNISNTCISSEDNDDEIINADVLIIGGKKVISQNNLFTYGGIATSRQEKRVVEKGDLSKYAILDQPGDYDSAWTDCAEWIPIAQAAGDKRRANKNRKMTSARKLKKQDKRKKARRAFSENF